MGLGDLAAPLRKTVFLHETNKRHVPFSAHRSGLSAPAATDHRLSAASSLLSLRDQHEIPRGLHVQLGTLFVADHHGFFAAEFVHPLIRRNKAEPALHEEDSQATPGDLDA
jgi:hypothetical protein